MTGRTSWGIDTIRGGSDQCDCVSGYLVSTKGQDIEISWDAYAPFGYGYGGTPWGWAPYGGVAHKSFRGYIVEIYFIIGGQDHLVRRKHVWSSAVVYTQAENRWDAKQCGCLGVSGFQATVKFVVYPITGLGKGNSLSYTTTTTSADPKILQGFGSGLWALSGVTPSADKIFYFTGETTGAVSGLTTFGRSLIDDADNTAARTTLGLGSVAVKNIGDFPTAFTAHFESFRGRVLTGTHASTPTLAIADATILSGGDPETYFAGVGMADALVTWLGFGFMVPHDILPNSDIYGRVCFALNSSGSGADVEFTLIGGVYKDGDPSGTPSTTFSVLNITSVDGYSAGDIVIVDLESLGLTLNAGDYIQGVLQRDATSGNDTYADTIGMSWLAFFGTRNVIT